MNLLGSKTLRRARTAIFAALAAGALTVGAMAVFAPTGCSNSNCTETSCPPTQVYIGSADGNTPITVDGIALAGPACPPNYGVVCIGTPANSACTHFTVTGLHPGSCDVGIHFSDRDPEVVHLEFGEAQSCCPGYPVIGDWNFTVSTSPDAGIVGNLSGADAITIITDAGTD